MMSNVRALRSENISPEIVLQSLRKALDAGEFDDIYVVTLSKKEDGEPLVYASGDLNRMGFAALLFQSYALKFINGEILPE